ncbi:MAG: ATP-binding protein [Proteobacteria bacterium]|nr:ATP-binding protein [Pseudomonadota bacterium]MBU2260359.1 ATP-binding protein [Pseudomonadota bacterium]
MTDVNIRAIYGLKYNPFLPNLPVESLWVTPEAERFSQRVQALAPQGGFALITGDPGQGKSKTLQWIAQQLSRIPDIVVGIMERPQSKPADFYRELGELFGVALTPLNRYGSFKALRARWKAHCQSTLVRPVLLIDEAQEVSSPCLTELRLLQSACFDSESLLFTILCGDGRLPDRFRTPDLLPLGSRIRARLQLTPLTPEQLQEYLKFTLEQAGYQQLMTPELIQTLAAHSLNNLRVLNHMAAEMLAAATERNLPRLDESLYFELFSPAPSKPRRNKGA